MKKLPSLLVSACLLMLGACGEDPEADFTWEPLEPRAGEEVQFTNLSANARSYSWNFGDMSIGDEANPVHVYEYSGSYIIDLYAFSGFKTDLKTLTITISE